MTESQFLPQTELNLDDHGSVTWKSPSNIALVKYWGKYGVQLPSNPSVSFTLSESHTVTKLSFQKKENQTDFEFEVFLDDSPAPDFKPKIRQFFERIESYLPFLKHYKFIIETSNSFPHSSGIASSASGMSALALCLMEMERQFSDSDLDDTYFRSKASFLSRLGSGSACRSIDGPLVVWGQHEAIPGSSDLFGVNYPLEVHPVFQNFQDTILLVDKGEKQVSSTVGHGLMKNHPYAEKRFETAKKNMQDLIPVFSSGNLEEFIKIVESEALQLHAMMMSSQPYFILMKPNTLQIINRIWGFRKETGLPLCFTLDAGANVHLLYPSKDNSEVMDFIKAELIQFCKNGEYIADQAGSGASRI